MTAPWIVVLTDRRREGTKLRALTRAVHGHDVAKPFALLVGDRSLLQLTVERATQLTTRERILVVVEPAHAELARRQLARYPGVELILQICPGEVLPSLARIVARDPGGHVVFMPADQYIANPAPLIAALRAAPPDQVCLIGATPTSADTDYGWVVQGDPLGYGSSHGYHVAHFIERPDSALADSLFHFGGLWNTSIHGGAVMTYWSLARKHLPLDPLVQANVIVVPVAGMGWSDWSSPRRVFESLVGTPLLDPLLARMVFAGSAHAG